MSAMASMELPDVFIVVGGEGDVAEDDERQPDFFRIDQCHVLLDDAFFFQPFDAFVYRGFGQVQIGSEGLGIDFGVVLQGFQYFQVGLVQRGHGVFSCSLAVFQVW